jgi:hypothetical protein
MHLVKCAAFAILVTLIALVLSAVAGCAASPPPTATPVSASTLVPPSPTPTVTLTPPPTATRSRPTPTFVVLPTVVPRTQTPPVSVVPTPNADVSFIRDVQPIFRTICARCHGGLDPIQELNLETREGALMGGLSGVVIKPGDPAGSIMVRYLQNDFMPFETEPKLTRIQKQSIVNWIAAGAPDN